MVHEVSRTRMRDDDDHEVPKDLNGYWGHPLNSSFDKTDGAALLHEFECLPAIERNGSTVDTVHMSPPSSTGTARNISEEYSLSPKMVGVAEFRHQFHLTPDSSEPDDFEKLVEDTVMPSRENCTTNSSSSGHLSQLSFKSGVNTDSFSEELSKADNSQTMLFDEELLSVEEFRTIDDILGEAIDTNNNGSLELSDSICRKDSSTPSPQDSKTTVSNDQQKAEIWSTEQIRTSSPTEHTDRKNTVASANGKSGITANHNNQLKAQSETLPCSPGATISCGKPIDSPAGENDQSNSTSSMLMPYPMMPQLMPMQIVQTSSGPMQVQPFIHNGQFGIAQLSPYRPTHMPNVSPMVNHHPPVHWRPQYYPPYNMGCRMVSPEQLRFPSPMCNSTQEYYPVPPAGTQQSGNLPAITKITTNTPANLPTVSAPTKLPTSMPVCEQIKIQQRLQQSRRSAEFVSDQWEDSDKPTFVQSLSTSGCRPIKECVKSGTNHCDTLNQIHITSEGQFPLATTAAEHLKSPDSGFDETGMDVVPTSLESEVSASCPPSPMDSISCAGNRKRRHGCISRQNSNRNSNSNSVPADTSKQVYAKRELDDTGYKIQIDAPTSCSARAEDDQMTYLNKGQHYTLKMENTIPSPLLKSSFVKSVVVLRFREEHSKEAMDKGWEYWHSRQTERDNPHVMDIDLKNSEGIIADTLEYIGVNALTFAWDPHEPVQAKIAIHCLSTDFSCQKGVKGLPLHIQIDTYDDVYTSTKCPVHRAYAQIKAFCDKGAERKLRDEEKRKEKASKAVDLQSGAKLPVEQYHTSHDYTVFYSMSDLLSDPYIYYSSALGGCSESRLLADISFPELPVPIEAPSLPEDSIPSFLDADFLTNLHKKPKIDDDSGVLVYVRESHESIFTPLLLMSPTLRALCQSIKDKFSVISDVRMIYKRTCKGILVKMDDNMVKRLTHESMYMIDFKQIDNQRYDITLIETDL